MAGVSPARAAFRDISNDIATPSPAHGKQIHTGGASTPPPGSTDKFVFGEEDDDEVLFKVRDFGGLGLPGLMQPSAVTPENAVEADDTVEQKQVAQPALLVHGVAGSRPSSSAVMAHVRLSVLAKVRVHAVRRLV